MTTKTHTEQHITYELVKEMADGLSEGCPFSYNLKLGDSAWNPASTKRLLYGPAKVTYRRYADGGISATCDAPELVNG